MKLAITFGMKYNDPNHPRHPASDEITADTYVVFEGDDWNDARTKALKALGTVSGHPTIADWAFDYDFDSDSFQGQIRRYNLREVKLSSPVVVNPDRVTR